MTTTAESQTKASAVETADPLEVASSWLEKLSAGPSLDRYVLAGIDPVLEASLQNEWNAKIVSYDRERFPFDQWILERVKRMGYPIETLDRLHEAVPNSDTYKVTKQLCADTGLPEFKRMVNDFVREVAIVQGKLVPPVAVQRFLNVRIMLPNKPQGIFPFHTGLLYGHGPASRSLWMPLTDVTAADDWSASMQIIDVNKSRELISDAIKNRLGVHEMTELFGKESWPLLAGPGDVVFFTQENIHGNVVNVTGKTRVSIDFRLAEGRFGNMLNRKIAGGYFAILHDDDDGSQIDPASFQNGKPNLLYLANATPGTEGAPVHLQRYMVFEYCKKNDLQYGFELFELEAMTHLPTLQHIVTELASNVVLYSVFALPADKSFRHRIVDAALANGLIMHFVNEDMVIRNEADRDRVEELLAFATPLPSSETRDSLKEEHRIR